MVIKANLNKLLSYLFGIVVLAIGLVNTFWGNDPGFGIFFIGLCLIYFLPISTYFNNALSTSIVVTTKILLGIFILWAALGVGELFDKIHLMMLDFGI